MPRRPVTYPPACREQIIALARAERTPKELAAEFEPSEQMIRNWLFHAAAGSRRTARRAHDGGAQGTQAAAAREPTAESRA